MAKRWIMSDRKWTAISCLPKNGSTSMKRCKSPIQFLTPEEAMHQTIRVGIIREPLLRLISMYRFLKNQHETGASTLANVPTKTWEEFIDYTLTHEDNHWKPQCELLETPEGEWVPTICYRFEDIDQYWPLYFDVKLPMKNTSPSAYEVNEYKMDEVLTKYRRDIELWQSLGEYNGRKGL